MSFLKELVRKKEALRKSEGVPEKAGNLEVMIVKEEEDYFRLMKETYFEAYYHQIEQFTFKSVILPLTLQEIGALHESHRLFLEGGDYDAGETLRSVEAKVEDGIAIIRKKANKECKVFVRLSSRSPKDAIYHLKSFKPLVEQKLAEFDDQDDIFSKLHAFYKASTEVMAIQSGKEAAELLTKSERIQGDLDVCLKSSEPMSLVVREFVQFPVKNELRGFVYKGVLTALTQYNNLAFFPECLEGKAEVETKVKAFMVDFILVLQSSLENFIVDIVIDDEGKVWVVEVNPFGELAGSCLFGWSRDRDLLMGKRPFEFRIVEEPPGLGLIRCEVDPRVLSIIGAN